MSPALKIHPVLSLCWCGAYRVTSFIRDTTPVGPCSSPMPRDLSHTVHHSDVDLNCSRSAHYTRFLRTSIFEAPHHTRFADLHTAMFFGLTSPTPPENGARDFSGRKRCQNSQEKWVLEWCSVENRTYMSAVTLTQLVLNSRSTYPFFANLKNLRTAHTFFCGPEQLKNRTHPFSVDLNYSRSAH